MFLESWRECFLYVSFGAKDLSRVLVVLKNMSPVCCLILFRMSVSLSLRYMSVPRSCSGYCCTTSQISWCGRRTSSYQRSSSPGMACLITWRYINPYVKHITKLTEYFSIHAGQKKMHTTVYCTMMSTTRTTMWSTPCSGLLTVIRLKHRHTQHLLTRRYFWFYWLITFPLQYCYVKGKLIWIRFHNVTHHIHCRSLCNYC